MEISDLWNSLSRNQFANVDDGFIETFRRPGGASNRLACWDPLDATMRYFKFLLYTAAARQPERFFALYRRLGRVDLGQPVSVTVRSCAINIDYFLAIEELLFLESALDLRRVRSIVEIGGGFGRTCHALLALGGEEVEQYTIVDLPKVLELSRRALEKLIPQFYSKVRFVDATNETEWRGLRADLVINIDSFQEMPVATIDSYMTSIVAGCRYFYVKNPIAKYDPKSIGLSIEDPGKLCDVFALGYCREVIDIFDDVALAGARVKYLEAYRPSHSEVVGERPTEMFPYYHHALFARREVME